MKAGPPPPDGLPRGGCRSSPVTDQSNRSKRFGMTTNAPLLSVALPTFNGARHLSETLRGVLNQSDVDFDLLVCDDRSDDDTLDLIRREAGDRARIEVNSERLGLAGNWNRCASLVRTPWLAIVHQDDVLLPGHLDSHRQAIDQRGDLGMICGATEVIDAASQPIPASVMARPDLGTKDCLFPPGGFVPELATRNPVRCSAVTLRTQALKEVGGFDPSYRYAVDWECWLRIARKWPIFWKSQPSVAVRWHPESETHRFRRGTDDLEEVARLLHLVHDVDAPLLPDPAASRRSADQFLAQAFLNRALDALHAGDSLLAQESLRRAWPPSGDPRFDRPRPQARNPDGRTQGRPPMGRPPLCPTREPVDLESKGVSRFPVTTPSQFFDNLVVFRSLWLRSQNPTRSCAQEIETNPIGGSISKK